MDRSVIGIGIGIGIDTTRPTSCIDCQISVSIQTCCPFCRVCRRVQPVGAKPWRRPMPRPTKASQNCNVGPVTVPAGCLSQRERIIGHYSRSIPIPNPIPIPTINGKSSVSFRNRRTHLQPTGNGGDFQGEGRVSPVGGGERGKPGEGRL